MLNRRLIGPTIIVLALFGLLADHLFMSESRWSASRFLGKFFAILTAIFSPSVDQALYPWIRAIFVPVLLVGLAIVLLFLTVARAKRSMSRATPNADTAASTARRAQEVPFQIELSSQSITAPRSPTRRNTILSNWAYSFGTVGLLFGIVICLIVFSFLSRAIERQSKNRVAVMSMGLGEIVAPALASGQINAVTAAVERFASSNSVAYIYLEDAEGRVIAHWPRDLPRHLPRDFPNSTERALQGIDTEYQGMDTYEVARRVGNGKLGFIHLAIWRQAINAEAYRFTTAIAAMTLIVFFCIIGSFLLWSRSLIRPLTDLVEQAARLSKGDFEVALELQRSDEFGDIALSLERLRSSLRAVTVRLDKTQLTQRSGE